MVRTPEGDFISIFPPSPQPGAFIDMEVSSVASLTDTAIQPTALEILAKDPLRQVYIDHLSDPMDLYDEDSFRVSTKFCYPQDTSLDGSGPRQEGDPKVGITKAPGAPFESDITPYAYDIVQDVHVIVHTDFRWIEMDGNSAQQDSRPLKMALARLRKIDGVQIAAVMSPYTMFYSVAFLFQDRKELIEKNVEAALTEAAKDYRAHYCTGPQPVIMDPDA